jgi:hypothetical protein
MRRPVGVKRILRYFFRHWFLFLHRATVVTLPSALFDERFDRSVQVGLGSEIRNAAGLPGLRFHDLRHQAITELAESQASDQTIMSVAGHVSPRRTLDQQALVRLREDEQRRGYGTENGTNPDAAQKSALELPENMVSAAGFEPATHALKGHCSTN